MEEKPNDEPAFPWGEHGQIMGGMTLRDYFAAKAMQAIYAEGPDSYAGIANEAYKVADAMIKARGGV